jgi:SAM-dependent methyltransferase
MEKLELGEVQFYWRTTSRPGVPRNPVANFMPFSFSVNKQLDLVIQSPSSEVDNALDTIYLEPDNVGYLQDGHALAESYGKDFLDFADRQLSTMSKGTVLEIGSGAAWLLGQFRLRGWTGIGCDPSPFAANATASLGFEHLSCFYTAELVLPSVDLIVHYDVLEHVRNPVEFLRANKSHLSPGGLVVFAVPDCTQQIHLGDISMVLHEHVNYFTISSLRTVVEAAGLSVIEIKSGETGGVLFCAAKVNQGISDTKSPSMERVVVNEEADNWIEKASKNLRVFNEIMPNSNEDPNPIALYIPLRAFPYLGKTLESANYVLIDDDPGVQGRYFDGVPTAIVGSKILDEIKFSVIVAMTFSYEQVITQRVSLSLMNSNTPIISPSTLEKFKVK